MDNAVRKLLNPKTHKSHHHRGKRDAVADRIKLWPGGVVPYTIEDSIGKTVYCTKLICTRVYLL